MIDGSDSHRLQEAKESIEEVFEYEELLGQPALFLLNKNDLPDFLGTDYLNDKLRLSDLKIDESMVVACSALKFSGIESQLNWLFQAVADNKRSA